MSYCLNPNCPKPDDESNAKRRICCQCGSDLLLQGRYRVLKKMGGGGFGQTFEILDKKDNTRKVLKVLLKEHPKAIALFKQEAKVLSQLNHPGIPRVDADGYFTFMPKEGEPLHCLVMEKIEGLNLQEWMKERKKEPIDPEQALEWLRQLADILDRVHSLQYFHRDIKPQNIMRKPDGQLVLIDFGTAREVTETIMGFAGDLSDPENEKKHATGIVSPGYTPPEQTNGKAVPQSDFFALGRTFVYLLTGKPPTAYPENPRTGKLLWRKGAPNLSKQLADVMDYLMAPFPGNRPQNPQVILQCLAEVELHRPEPEEEESDKDEPKDPKKKKPKPKDGEKRPFNFRIPLKAMGIMSAVLATSTLIYTQVDGYLRYGFIPTNPALVLKGLPNSLWLQGYERALGQVYALTIAPDGQTLVAGTFGTIRRWNLNSGQFIDPPIAAHSSWVKSLAIAPDGEIVASGSNDKTIRLWNLQQGIRQRTIEGHTGSVNALEFSPDGQILASGSDDRTIRLWDASGVRIRTIPAHDAPINALAFSPDGRVIASGSTDGTIKLWNIGDGIRRLTIGGHSGGVNAIAYTPDGQTIASASDDGSVRLWNAATGDPVRVLRGHEGGVKALAITPDGQTLIGGGDRIILWDLETGQKLATLWGHSRPVTALAVSPDGKTLASGSEDKTIKIWALQLEP
ncbi:serine/threonine-protein kinase [Lyngbya sp. CCY1209]|uniref:serine/threonine-protein kinase n=1 Tax=Lyngbya sp. CCY1209 TaxID=2886103 RepID=UPI002D213D66|nr:serine/threonine-protein kinase [Lyngbya sp. CCY1209]MEB3883556.1 serine/threonine protein kinase [Lyngbya sp. CCY1209]